MPTNLYLEDLSSKYLWPLRSAAIFSEIETIPRLFVCIDSVVIPECQESYDLIMIDSDSPLAAGKRMRWFATETHVTYEPTQIRMTLVAEPSAAMQMSPFGENYKSAEEIISPRLDAKCVKWDGPKQDIRVDTFVSVHESLEQLIRRLARLMGRSFNFFSTDEGTWRLKWDESIARLYLSDLTVKTHTRMRSSSTYQVEGNVRTTRLPNGYSENLRKLTDPPTTKQVFRLIQTAVSGDEAVSEASCVNENGESLRNVATQWFELSSLSSLMEVFRGAAIENSLGDATEQYFPLLSVFFYDSLGGDKDGGLAHGSRTANLEFEEFIGRSENLPTINRGWQAYSFAVPKTFVPKDKEVLMSVLHRSGAREFCRRVINRNGHNVEFLSAEPSPSWGTLPAIVSENPRNPASGSVSLSEDQQAYRTRIWIKLLGMADDLEVDWAIPFASHDNSQTGGGSGGDFILVPEKNSLGYVGFLDNNAAPFFFATTHFPDQFVSKNIWPQVLKHGLSISGGLALNEATSSILMHAYGRINLISASYRNQIGEKYRIT